MYQRLLGVETEYAASAVDERGRRIAQTRMLGELMRRARRRLRHLPDEQSDGVFLENGARFYVDAGGHPELTTPECANPWDVVRYVRAGESILLGLASDPGASVATSFYRTNVDYSGSGTTWGCHESYMHRARPDQLPPQLIPHLVSRIVFTGAGGFDNTAPGLVFMLSPRAAHVQTAMSRDSTGNRGIFHLKDEPLCSGGWHRLHVIFGESLCSELSTWLKLGTTALVLALCEAGRRPGDAIALNDPVDAAHAIAIDPSCSVTVATASGPRSAVAMQRHLLEQVEACIGAAFLPSWAEAVCRRWRDVLDRLEGGWAAVSTQLDWAIKHALYRDRVRRRGLTWESLEAWTQVLGQTARAVAATPFSAVGFRPQLLLRPPASLAGEIAHAKSLARALGVDWGELEQFLQTRAELLEIDMRFGQLGARGVFTALDASGLLEHRVGGIDDVARAVHDPPDVPRARARGQLVRELAVHGARYRCGWDGVSDFLEEKRVDLGDPFRVVLEWKPSLLTRRARGSAPPEDPVTLNEAALQLRQLGELAEAERLLRRAIEIEDARVPPDSGKRPHRRNNLALVLMRAGNVVDAAALNAQAWELKARLPHDVTSGRILFVRIALRRLGGLDVAFHLGQLKSLLGHARLECLVDVRPRWDIPDVLEMLADQLDVGWADLLLRLARALNAHPDLADLEEVESWNAIEPVPLDVPWPDA